MLISPMREWEMVHNAIAAMNLIVTDDSWRTDSISKHSGSISTKGKSSKNIYTNLFWEILYKGCLIADCVRKSCVYTAGSPFFLSFTTQISPSLLLTSTWMLYRYYNCLISISHLVVQNSLKFHFTDRKAFPVILNTLYTQRIVSSSA